MHYIVIDLEFNQAYDFENNCPKAPFEGCRFEIIQIGAVKLDENFEILDTFNVYIKPNLYKQIHPYVKKVTSIEESMLEDKNNFKDEFLNFLKFIGSQEDYILCVWGNNDIRTLYRNLCYHKLIKDKFILRYIDIQSIATKYLKFNKGTRIGLKKATELLEVESSEDSFHNALNDALYTAKIFQKLSKEKINIKIFNSNHI